MRLRKNIRPGATVVESAVIYPVTLLLVLGLIIGGLGIFRFQEVSSLARRAARYAAVHGKVFAQVTREPAATPEEIYNNAIRPYAFTLNPSRLSYAVSYNSDNSPASPVIQSGDVKMKRNTVTVTVSFNWIPEAFLGGVTLSSTSTVPMSY
jgi:Flp pilus assembly protein TadG